LLDFARREALSSVIGVGAQPRQGKSLGAPSELPILGPTPGQPASE
jgi:hypothetical protein